MSSKTCVVLDRGKPLTGCSTRCRIPENPCEEAFDEVPSVVGYDHSTLTRSTLT